MPKKNSKFLDTSVDRLEKALKKKERKDITVGLSNIYKNIGCNAIAKEIKAGRNVTGNAEYGIRLCVHNKLAPTVDPKTLKFSPQTERQKKLEKKFVDNVNILLKKAGYKKMSSSLLSDLRRKDKKFEEEIKKLKRK